MCVDSGHLVIFNLKKKDEIDLSKSEMESEPKQGLNENNKYMFSIKQKQKGVFGTNKTSKLTLGTDSDQARKDWIFILELAKLHKSKMRDSAFYVNELKKKSIFSVIL